MDKSTFMKRKYQHTWKEGNARELVVKKFLERIGMVVEPYGFGALSDKYYPESPSEPGIPDLKATYKGKIIYFEVTGTRNINIRPNDKLWIRPDKINYAKKHKDKVIYLAHVLDRYNYIRFIRLDRAEGELIKKSIRQKDPKYNSIDRFVSISPINFMSVYDFEILLND